jgi:tetratricopeptide (TPR) repeat protein
MIAQILQYLSCNPSNTYPVYLGKNVRSCIIVIAILVFFMTTPVSGYSDAAVSWYSAGLALTDSGNYSLADQAFERAVTLEPNYFEAWNGKADAFNRAKDYQDALAASDQTLLINPYFVKGWINRGYILYNLGRYDDELKAYDRAIEIEPASTDAWFNRGYALAAMGRYDEAIRAFDHVAEFDPLYPNLQTNRRIAASNRDAATPLLVKYAPWIAISIFTIGGIGGWIYAKRRKKYS